MKKILKKVLDELAKDEPNLSYIRGLLEAVSDEETQYSPISINTPPSSSFYRPLNPEIRIDNTADEASILEAKVKAHIEKHGLPKEIKE